MLSTTISPATATPVTATSSGLSFVTTGGLEFVLHQRQRNRNHPCSAR